jgi:hypothetical protein
MKKSSYLSLVLAIVVLVGLVLGGCRSERTLTISGAWALYPMVVRWGEGCLVGGGDDGCRRADDERR